MAFLLLYLLIPFWMNTTLPDESIIKQKLMHQQKCWNAGDIDGFMRDYWHSDSLMYIGKNGVTYGWQNTLDNYKKKYPTQREMGHLEFELIRLKRLNDDHYFMVGKWHLQRQVGDIGGHFSLIWKKTNSDWVIIADHSS